MNLQLFLWMFPACPCPVLGLPPSRRMGSCSGGVLFLVAQLPDLSGGRRGRDAPQEAAPQLSASPGTHSGVNVQLINSLWHYWEQCHPCGTGMSAWLVSFPCSASSWLFCSLPPIAAVPVQAPVCTRAQFVLVQAPVCTCAQFVPMSSLFLCKPQRGARSLPCPVPLTAFVSRNFLLAHPHCGR